MRATQRLLHTALCALFVTAPPTLLLGGCAGTSSPGDAVVHRETDWSTNATEYRGQAGRHVAFDCPANPLREGAGSVWGTDVYTDDSAVCVAAVHAGRISFDRGGRVTVEIRDGQASYRGTTAKDVESQDYGAWDGSYSFVGS